ncbi:translation initiation factor [Piptocephalis cylindrospora]|uniref:Translation initiation factor n=1 Tax=Piptocephalis cylindrospora TaxID=1907219 RepID=A0A4P9Y7R5_9FUNG|nr:translation initiation factor [Piptocephalis cylindrospora]|eukprot:RKP13980.1 translation initiation factor [Piptocephalis cylindrospora]
MSVNIRRDVQDSFYRYKMPQLISKVEGKGNGIKTVIPNMTDIAKALARPPAYPTKFIGVELGAQVKCNEVADRYIVNGAHDAPKLASLLDTFINRFVLCGKCKNPETDLLIRDNAITRDCKACGKRTPIEKHKLVPFILKNPPPVSSQYGKRAKQAMSKQGAGSLDIDGSGAGDDQDGSGGSDDELTRRITAEAAALPSSGAGNGNDNDGDDTDDDWAEDTSPEAQAERMRAIERELNTNLVLGEDEEDGAGNGKYETFGLWLEAHPSTSDAEIVEEAKSLGVLGKHRTVQVLVQCVLTDEKALSAQVTKRVPLLRQFVKTEKDQKSLLGGLERLFGLTFPSLLPKLPIVLKVLFDADLIDEEVLLKWGEKASKKYVDKSISKKVKTAAIPFLNWLEEAEEESDDDEDEESDDE